VREGVTPLPHSLVYGGYNMNVKRELLEKMTKKDLIEHGNLTFGLSLNANHHKEDIVNAIERAGMRFRGNQDLSAGDVELKPDYTKIRLSAGELNPTGRPVIVGLNGKMYSIPVGVEINVPNPLVEILSNAIKKVYKQDPRTNELIVSEVNSYPFSIIARG
jgi:hypothetical protein